MTCRGKRARKHSLARIFFCLRLHSAQPYGIMVSEREEPMIKTSIRFFEDIPVRAVWEEQTSKWWFCAADIAEALTKSKNPRSYWNVIKRRNPQLSTICRQLRLRQKADRK